MYFFSILTCSLFRFVLNKYVLRKSAGKAIAQHLWRPALSTLYQDDWIRVFSFFQVKLGLGAHASNLSTQGLKTSLSKNKYI